MTPSVSPPVSVVEAPGDFAPPTATPPSLPGSGGDVVITVPTSLPDGTLLHLLLSSDPAVAGTDTGITATVAAGSASATFTAKPNPSITAPANLVFTFST
jgi:hypothetical protein